MVHRAPAPFIAKDVLGDTAVMFPRIVTHHRVSPDPDLYIPTWLIDTELLVERLNDLDSETLARLTALRLERRANHNTEGENS